MGVPEFEHFYLVGGTALALQLGHRNSVDIDLFGAVEINEMAFSTVLNTLGSAQILKKSKNILVFTLDGVKVDFVNYQYPWIAAGSVIDNIRIASFEDIAAMKLNAIAGRGSKKDFIDLFFLLKQFSLKEMLSFYSKKYHDGSTFLVVKSLAYFGDAEQEVMPIMHSNVSWEIVKKGINNALLNL